MSKSLRSDIRKKGNAKCSRRSRDDRLKQTDGSKEAPDGLAPREAYNVVTDTVAGPNLRLKDNVIQAIVIAVCLLLGAAIGAILVEERLPGALAGGFVGMVVGLLGSGFFLMVYRAWMHIRGRHD